MTQPTLAAEIPLATDLARAAREAGGQGKVLVVLYGTTTCPWCTRVRRNYLVPLTRDPEATMRMVIAEVDPEASHALTDFAGHATDHRSLARTQAVRVVPTVVIYGRDGALLAKPLVGMPSEDFYGAFLEERLSSARVQLLNGR